MFSFRKESDRNTQAYIVSFGPHRFYVSYETVVGYSGPLGRCRVENVWGPTTGRHLAEFGIKDAPIVSDDEIEQRWKHTLTDLVGDPIARAIAEPWMGGGDHARN